MLLRAEGGADRKDGQENKRRGEREEEDTGGIRPEPDPPAHPSPPPPSPAAPRISRETRRSPPRSPDPGRPLHTAAGSARACARPASGRGSAGSSRAPACPVHVPGKLSAAAASLAGNAIGSSEGAHHAVRLPVHCPPDRDFLRGRMEIACGDARLGRRGHQAAWSGAGGGWTPRRRPW